MCFNSPIGAEDIIIEWSILSNEEENFDLAFNLENGLFPPKVKDGTPYLLSLFHKWETEVLEPEKKKGIQT